MCDEISFLRDHANAYIEHALVLCIEDDNLQAALTAYENARLLFAELRDQQAQIDTLVDMAWISQEMGDHGAAHRYYQKILLVYDNNTPRWRYRFVFFNLKNLSLKQGYLTSALSELKQLSETYDAGESRKSRRHQVDILREMADIAERVADISSARNYFAQAAFLSEHPDVDSTFAAWEWGQMEYRQGNTLEGYALCRYAVWLDQTGLEDAVMDESPAYTQFFINRQDRIDSRQQSLAAMIFDTSIMNE